MRNQKLDPRYGVDEELTLPSSRVVVVQDRCLRNEDYVVGEGTIEIG